MKNSKQVRPALERRLRRRDFLRLAAASTATLAVGGLFSACDTGESNSQTGTEQLGFTTYLLTEAEGEDVVAAVRQIVTDYEERTGANIETAAYPYDDYLDQVIVQARGGNVSGVAHVNNAWIPTLATLGVLTEVAPLVEENAYSRASLRTGTFRGTRYALPWNVSSIGLVANTELLERAGISEMPRTIDDFEQALESLKGLGQDFIPYAASTALGDLKDIVPWMWTCGGDIVSGDTVTLGDNGSVRAVEWMRSLLERELIAPEVARTDARTFFAQSRAAFYEDDPGAVTVIPRQSSDKEIASKMAPMPRPVEGSGDPQAQFADKSLVVFNQGRTDAVDEFAKHLSTDLEVLRILFETVGHIPPTEEALQSEWYTDNDFFSTWSDEITRFAQVNPFWSYEQSAQMEQVLSEQVQAALLGNVSSQTAMERAREEIQSLIE